MAAQQQDVDTLKRRGRRRLVGAVALVLLAIVVLPMVFDQEPAPPAPAPSVRIPGEDDKAFDPAPLLAKPAGQYVVPVGAFNNPKDVVARLAAERLPYFTEEVATSKGKVTRVRAGPFPSRQAAQKAAERLKSMGLSPGSVIEGAS